MPRLPEGKKVFKTSLHKDLISELEEACDIMGMTRTRFMELAIKHSLNQIKDSALWKGKYKEWEKRQSKRAKLRAELKSF